MTKKGTNLSPLCDSYSANRYWVTADGCLRSPLFDYLYSANRYWVTADGFLADRAALGFITYSYSRFSTYSSSRFLNYSSSLHNYTYSIYTSSYSSHYYSIHTSSIHQNPNQNNTMTAPRQSHPFSPYLHQLTFTRNLEHFLSSIQLIKASHLNLLIIRLGPFQLFFILQLVPLPASRNFSIITDASASWIFISNRFSAPWSNVSATWIFKSLMIRLLAFNFCLILLAFCLSAFFFITGRSLFLGAFFLMGALILTYFFITLKRALLSWMNVLNRSQTKDHDRSHALEDGRGRYQELEESSSSHSGSDHGSGSESCPDSDDSEDNKQHMSRFGYFLYCVFDYLKHLLLGYVVLPCLIAIHRLCCQIFGIALSDAVFLAIYELLRDLLAAYLFLGNFIFLVVASILRKIWQALTYVLGLIGLKRSRKRSSGGPKDGGPPPTGNTGKRGTGNTGKRGPFLTAVYFYTAIFLLITIVSVMAIMALYVITYLTSLSVEILSALAFNYSNVTSLLNLLHLCADLILKLSLASLILSGLLLDYLWIMLSHYWLGYTIYMLICLSVFLCLSKKLVLVPTKSYSGSYNLISAVPLLAYGLSLLMVDNYVLPALSASLSLAVGSFLSLLKARIGWKLFYAAGSSYLHSIYLASLSAESRNPVVPIPAFPALSRAYCSDDTRDDPNEPAEEEEATDTEELAYTDDDDSDSDFSLEDAQLPLDSVGIYEKVLTALCEQPNYSPSKRNLYVQRVCDRLADKHSELQECPSEEERSTLLRSLQLEIESSTVQFDEPSIYSSSLDLFDKLTSGRTENMRDRLISEFREHDLVVNALASLGVHTVEILVIYAMGQLFNNHDDPHVRAATFVDKMGRLVLRDVIVLRGAKAVADGREVDAVICHKLGAKVLTWIHEKGLVEFTDIYSERKLLKSESGYFLSKSPLYVRCTYDCNLLPVKLNLPMVVRPKDWQQVPSQRALQRSESLEGGYLTDSTAAYYRYRLISSRNLDLFKLCLGVVGDGEYLKFISALQKVAFRVDERVLTFLEAHKRGLTKRGLLADDRHIGVDPNEFLARLRSELFYRPQKEVDSFNYSALWSEFMANSHKARSERWVLDLAKAYRGYDLYFPAFQDFRGRVYRTGIFNLHERDLYRSLLVFEVPDGQGEGERRLLKEIPDTIKVATCKRYASSFPSYEEAIEWFDNWYSGLGDKEVDDYILDSMVKAKDPFQFMRKALLVLKGGCYEAEPIFMDASASAYQILSYLTQDLALAEYTNLIVGHTSRDLYTIMREKYVDDFQREGALLSHVAELRFDRKLVKKLVMPLTYGKTVKAMGDDLYQALGQYMSSKECLNLASKCHKLWCQEFPGAHNLLKLFGIIGGLCSSLNRTVELWTQWFSSQQDYRKFDTQSVWIYVKRKGLNKLNRRKISLNVLSKERNVLKSKLATFANFIHQKDALIALHLVAKFVVQYPGKPLYTVHDCFVSDHTTSHQLADLYKKTLTNSLGAPLVIVNLFLFRNLIAEFYPRYMLGDKSHPDKSRYSAKAMDLMDQLKILYPLDEYITVEPKVFLKKMKKEMPKLGNKQMYNYFHWVGDPIPQEHLEYFMNKLADLGPPSHRKKTLERGSLLISHYNTYVASLCGGRIIDRVQGNENYLQEVADQRSALGNVMTKYSDRVCKHKVCQDPGRNYSLT